MDELRWLLGMNLVMAIWLGMLADYWKGRRMYTWMVIGMLTSVVGLLALAMLPKLQFSESTEGKKSRLPSPSPYGN